MCSTSPRLSFLRALFCSRKNRKMSGWRYELYLLTHFRLWLRTCIAGMTKDNNATQAEAYNACTFTPFCANHQALRSGLTTI
jgi:hypothetical protein